MKLRATLLSLALLTTTGATMAADYQANPFTLTYDGAIRENVKGQVNLHTVHYPANGIEAAANVYTPAGFDPATPPSSSPTRTAV